jgi:hypothetical protein
MGTDNIARDIIYLDRARDTDVTWYQTAGPVYDDYTLERTFKVYAKGNNGLPVVGATVTAVNNYGQTALNGTTNSNGRYMDTCRYRRDYWTGGPDSLAFNPFSVKVKYGTDSTLHAKTIASSAAGGCDTLVLANTAGTGSWEEEEVAGIYIKNSYPKNVYLK